MCLTEVRFWVRCLVTVCLTVVRFCCKVSDASLTEVRFCQVSSYSVYDRGEILCQVSSCCVIQVSFFARCLFMVSDTSLAEAKFHTKCPVVVTLIA